MQRRKRAKDFISRNFVSVSEDIEAAVDHTMLIENIFKIRTASVLTLLFMVALLILDYVRYSNGKTAVGNVYYYLFLVHTSLSLFAIPLALISINKHKILKGNYRYAKQLVMIWIALISIIFIIMAALCVLERSSIMVYALYIILINFVLTLYHLERSLLNGFSFIVFMIAIYMVHPHFDEKMITLFLEVLSVTFIAFSLSTHVFNLMVKEVNSEKAVIDKNEQLEKARAESNRLLLNILPAEIAIELMEEGSVKPQNYSSTTVMMIDFAGFSRITKSMSSEELVATLDYCFSNFDRIILKYGIEKIKTLGDGYLCVGGIPTIVEDHAEKVILAAFDILDFLSQWKVMQSEKNLPYFEGRIGIHTGPLTAGVVGETKFAYDVWGDTVNIAARIESGGESGRINVSKDTYELIREKYQCLHRGDLPIKNLGSMEMYFVEKK